MTLVRESMATRVLWTMCIMAEVKAHLFAGGLTDLALIQKITQQWLNH